MIGWLTRILAVVALLGVAAALATPPGRLPLALRGLHRLLRKDRGLSASAPEARVTPIRKVLAFVLVLLAALVCLV